MKGDQMAIISHEVTKYAVDLFSGTTRWAQRVFLYGTDGNIKAVAHFYEEEGTMPPPSGSNVPGSIRLSYRSNRLDSVLDVLGNEKPLFVFYDEAGGYGQ